MKTTNNTKYNKQIGATQKSFTNSLFLIFSFLQNRRACSIMSVSFNTLNSMIKQNCIHSLQEKGPHKQASTYT